MAKMQEKFNQNKQKPIETQAKPDKKFDVYQPSLPSENEFNDEPNFSEKEDIFSEGENKLL